MIIYDFAWMWLIGIVEEWIRGTWVEKKMKDEPK